MKLDPEKTALLTLDFQAGILGFSPSAEAVVPMQRGRSNLPGRNTFY